MVEMVLFVLSAREKQFFMFEPPPPLPISCYTERGIPGFNRTCGVGYNEFDFFLENKEYRPFDGCKIEI
jgi:hypothetical protein